MSTEINATLLKSDINKGNKIVITTGMALFAMFFGAGNIVFPLFLGANSGQNIIESALGFLLAGVGVPFLGLMATSLYQGDYHLFFNRLGKWPAFLMITFLMIIIGPLAAMPRTEATTFNALLPFLPDFLKNNSIFSLCYCGIVFLLAYRETKVVSILGLILSPIKIVSFSILVFLGLLFSEVPLESNYTSWQSFQLAIGHGYNTMDLLATFFYCAVAFKAIEQTAHQYPTANSTTMTIKACILGALITGAVYIGFMIVAYTHASALQGLKEEQMISAISYAVLGKLGGLFVCVAVSFACVATALALAEVCSAYLYKEIFKERLSKRNCLLIVIITTYLISNLGFQGIMHFSMPILNVVYPALIVLCIMNILHKWKGIKMVKFPVLFTILASAFISFL